MITDAQRLDGVDSHGRCSGCGINKELMKNGFCASCQDHPSLKPAPVEEKKDEPTGFFKKRKK